MKTLLSFPSKTFLTGEYTAIVGGPSLVISTKPRFKLEVIYPSVSPSTEVSSSVTPSLMDTRKIKRKTSQRSSGTCRGIHKRSPGGIWVRNHPSCFHNANIHFIDPHKGGGGFGASTAQFLGVYTWTQLWEQITSSPQHSTLSTPIMNTHMLETLWHKYRKTAWVGEGARPSGTDLLSQRQGKISLFSFPPFHHEIFSWPFHGHGFLIVRSHHKLATHKHLKGKRENDFKSLKPLSSNVVDAFKKKNWIDFMFAQREFYKALSNMELTDIRSKEMICKIDKNPEIQFVKPCGALGLEVLMVFFEDIHRTKVQSYLHNLEQNLGLQVVSSDKDICNGQDIDFIVDEESQDKETMNHKEKVP